MSKPKAPASRFDKAYYAQFYGSSRTRIHGAKEVAHLGGMLVEMLAWYRAPLRSVLEVGAGVGLLRDWFAEKQPKVRYLSTEVSPYAAATYGHAARDISTWRSKRRFDLVVCQGVLPYLDGRQASAALENLAAMTRGFLYVEAITQRDYVTVCDRDKTDPTMRLRTAAFYKRRLLAHFTPLGGGLFYAKDGPLAFWELELG